MLPLHDSGKVLGIDAEDAIAQAMFLNFTIAAAEKHIPSAGALMAAESLWLFNTPVTVKPRDRQALDA